MKKGKTRADRIEPGIHRDRVKCLNQDDIFQEKVKKKKQVENS